MAETLRAKESFSYDVKGTPVAVRVGELRPAGHADVKGREHLFEAVEVAAERQRTRGAFTSSVEKATAGPGERRTLTVGK